ncbi:MAG: ATP-binding cassette domain-containing protein [Acidobacteriota bacterium]|nr:MAG: ATP-binding cassette domain-containing protein [Acidobacteriota bacterium]
MHARELTKAYRRRLGRREEAISVLAGTSIDVLAGERVAIQGASGVGKTTLLNILGGLDRPDGGVLLHKGRALPGTAADRARWRRREVGFVFQFHGLLAEFTAEENIALAGMIAGEHRAEALAAARGLLAELGLAARATHYPDELSGGEQQRVAVARALVRDPSLVLADEPTGDLDPRTGEHVIDLLVAQQERQGFALVMATHSEKLARRCHRILQMEGGMLRPVGPAGQGR